jgi:glycoside/pentoside/hexuronide:cation symporter, GPH family
MANTADPAALAAPIEASAPSETAAPLLSDRLPRKVKLAYGLGGTTDIFGHWLFLTLADPVFNTYFHLTPTQIGNVKGITLAVDACAGLLFGWLSDNTRSRWGRRRPYILFGSILAGVALPFLFLPTKSWSQEQIYTYMLFSSMLYAPIIAGYNSPYQSLGQELTPDYYERASVMGFKAIFQKSSGILNNGALWFASLPFFADPSGDVNVARGAMWAAAIAGAIMITSGIVNVSTVPERYYRRAQSQARVGVGEMFTQTFGCVPFLILLGVGFSYAIPTAAIQTLGFYAGNYYVLGDDLAGWGSLTFWSGLSYALCGIAAIYPAQRLVRLYGKRLALGAILALGLVTFGLSWVLYTPAMPRLVIVHHALNGLCATGLWVVLPSMITDVIDYDELRSGKRREGAFSSAWSWTIKAGMVTASIFAGRILDRFTGFDAALRGAQAPETMLWIRLLFACVPITACIVALIFLSRFNLSTERMANIRRELEARRGVV